MVAFDVVVVDFELWFGANACFVGEADVAVDLVCLCACCSFGDAYSSEEVGLRLVVEDVFDELVAGGVRCEVVDGGCVVGEGVACADGHATELGAGILLCEVDGGVVACLPVVECDECDVCFGVLLLVDV